jgi:CubicO group peptidase (beta-lactamase class C family)
MAGMRRLVILFLIAFPALAQQPYDLLASEAMKTFGLPALSVAVVQNDRVVYLKALGAEYGKSEPVTVDTLSRSDRPPRSSRPPPWLCWSTRRSWSGRLPSTP